MLVLSRKPGERVMIGDDIVLTIGATASSRVKLLFEAPAGVWIAREEMYRRRYGDAPPAPTDDGELLAAAMAWGREIDRSIVGDGEAFKRATTARNAMDDLCRRLARAADTAQGEQQ